MYVWRIPPFPAVEGGYTGTGEYVEFTEETWPGVLASHGTLYESPPVKVGDTVTTRSEYDKLPDGTLLAAKGKSYDVIMKDEENWLVLGQALRLQSKDVAGVERVVLRVGDGE